MKQRTFARLTLPEAALLTFAALLLAWQLFTRPFLGLADNGDFSRVMGRFSIGYDRGVAEQSYFRYFVRQYDIHPRLRHERPFLTSESFFVALSIPINAVFFGRRTYDLRSLGVVHLAVLVLCLAGLVIASRSFRRESRWILLGLTLLTFADTAYVAFFQSFYSETASLLFLLATIAAAIVVDRDPSAARIAGFVLLSVGFVLAKPQNVLGGVFLALLCLRLARRSAPGRRRWAITGAVALLAVSAAAYLATPRLIREATYHVAVFWEILGKSPDRAADAAELGLDPSVVRWAGTHPWSADAPLSHDPEFRRLFLDRISFGPIARFYATHPSRLYGLLDRAARDALRSRPPLGNFERGEGKPPGALSHKFDFFSRLKDRLLPRRAWTLATLFFLYVSALIVIWVRGSNRTRWLAELCFALVLIAATQFLLVAVTQGDIDTVKHMFLFRTVIDMLIVAAVSGLGSIPLTRRSIRER